MFNLFGRSQAPEVPLPPKTDDKPLIVDQNAKPALDTPSDSNSFFSVDTVLEPVAKPEEKKIEVTTDEEPVIVKEEEPLAAPLIEEEAPKEEPVELPNVEEEKDEEEPAPAPEIKPEEAPEEERNQEPAAEGGFSEEATQQVQEVLHKELQESEAALHELETSISSLESDVSNLNERRQELENQIRETGETKEAKTKELAEKREALSRLQELADEALRRLEGQQD